MESDVKGKTETESERNTTNEKGVIKGEKWKQKNRGKYYTKGAMPKPNSSENVNDHAREALCFVFSECGNRISHRGSESVPHCTKAPSTRTSKQRNVSAD